MVDTVLVWILVMNGYVPFAHFTNLAECERVQNVIDARRAYLSRCVQASIVKEWK